MADLERDTTADRLFGWRYTFFFWVPKTIIGPSVLIKCLVFMRKILNVILSMFLSLDTKVFSVVTSLYKILQPKLFSSNTIDNKFIEWNIGMILSFFNCLCLYFILFLCVHVDKIKLSFLLSLHSQPKLKKTKTYVQKPHLLKSCRCWKMSTYSSDESFITIFKKIAKAKLSNIFYASCWKCIKFRGLAMI